MDNNNHWDMSVRKTRTSTVEISLPWAKLISKSKGVSDYEIVEESITIGRKATNSLVINEQALSSTHCIIYKKDDKVFLKDVSSNGTYLNNTKIGTGNEVELEHLAEVWLLHPSRVAIDKTLGYTFNLVSKMKEEEEMKKVEVEEKQQNSASKDELKRKVEQLEMLEDKLKKQTEAQIQELAEQKKKAKAEKDAMDKILKDQITCSLCLEIMHVPVAVHPCNHHFCGGCLSLLVKSKQENCAQCRKQITTAQRDANFNVLIEQYLKTHTEDKRAQQETDELDKNNIFTFDATDYQEAIHGKKKDPPIPSRPMRGRPVAASRGGRAARRRASDLSASSSDSAGRGRCRECNVARNGFQCAAGQNHVNCHACGKAMADRGDPTLRQSCILCNQFYCNLYYPPCTPVGVKLDQVNNHGSKAKVTIDNFRGNTIEYSYFTDFVRSKRYTPAQLFDVIATKYLDANIFRFLFDRKVMKVPPSATRQVPVTRQSAVCTMCWPDLWFQLILRYRMEINNELPLEAKGRAPCYYGINCSTMGHKLDHAKKLNHCQFQTRF